MQRRSGNGDVTDGQTDGKSQASYSRAERVKQGILTQLPSRREGQACPVRIVKAPDITETAIIK